MALSKRTIAGLIGRSARHRCADKEVCVKIVAIANLPSRFGKFQVVAFQNNLDGKDHSAFVHGDVIGKENVLVRLHSECLTGDAIGSLRCDCRAQLEAALKKIGGAREGMLIYMRQEGRGIGFTNKIRAYQLQDSGYDTFEANEALGFKADQRDYEIAAHILRSLKVKSIKLMSNNPAKILDLKRHGIRITARIPLVTRPNKYDRFYLETKRTKGGQLLDSHKIEYFLEQHDAPDANRE